VSFWGRIRRLLPVLLASAVALLSPTGASAAQPKYVVFKARFEGTGTYTIDVKYKPCHREDPSAPCDEGEFVKPGHEVTKYTWLTKIEPVKIQVSGPRPKKGQPDCYGYAYCVDYGRLFDVQGAFKETDEETVADGLGGTRDASCTVEFPWAQDQHPDALIVYWGLRSTKGNPVALDLNYPPLKPDPGKGGTCLPSLFYELDPVMVEAFWKGTPERFIKEPSITIPLSYPADHNSQFPRFPRDCTKQFRAQFTQGKSCTQKLEWKGQLHLTRVGG
jgi:hypothetical protein